MNQTRRACLTVVLAGLGLLTACRGVPMSSQPEAVDSVGLGQGQGQGLQSRPNPGDGPREIVTGFLAANSIDPFAHSSARRFLAGVEQGAWSDATATIVADESVGTYSATRRTLTVYGRVVGNLDKNGVYKPTLSGVGDGGVRQRFDFALARVHGQYRISSVPRGLGLLLTTDQFAGAYQPRVLYFFDAADHYLVPDIRYSALVDAELADSLMSELISGPRPDLAGAVSSDTLPSRVPNLGVKLGAVTRVRMDGVRQLPDATRNRLAAQVGATLDDVVNGGEIMIVDGGTPVPIPHVSGVQFSGADFPADQGPRPAPQTVFYLGTNNRIKQDGGRALHGALGSASFTSVALARRAPNDRLIAAGVKDDQLVIVTESGVHQTGLRSPSLTRPVWVPGLNEVWVAAGTRLFRVLVNGAVTKVAAVELPPGTSSSGRIVALRMSPDGSRVALVFASGNQAGGTLEIGPIVRNGSVSVSQLVLISPEDVRITDVAWADSVKLFATGYLSKSKDARVFETTVDGDNWTDIGLSNLPAKPNTITATSGAPAWVDADGFVWKQDGPSWVSPGPGDQTPGTAPMYLG